MKKKLPSKNLDRRCFLRTSSGGLLTIPLLESLIATKADATPVIPTRLITFFLPNGISQADGSFWPKKNDDGSYSLGRSTSVLEPFKNQISFIRGLQYSDYKRGVPNGHDFATSNLFTCHGGQGTKLIKFGHYADGWANQASFDQFVADRLNLSSLVLGAASDPVDQMPMYSHAFWDKNLNGIKPIGTARETFELLTTGTHLNTSKSILDDILEDYKKLKSKISLKDAKKLEAHLSGLRDLEKNLQRETTIHQGFFDKFKISDLQLGKVTKGDDAKKMMEKQIQLLVMAFATGQADVGALQFSTGQSPLVWKNHQENHHTISHLSAGGELARRDRMLEEIDTEFMSMFATLLKELDSQKEADGKSMLYHSVVVIGYEYNNADVHKSQPSGRTNLPFIIAGNAGGKLKSGQLLDQLPPHSHGDLFDTLLVALGIEDQTFSNPLDTKGVLSELL